MKYSANRKNNRHLEIFVLALNDIYYPCLLGILTEWIEGVYIYNL